VAVRRGVWLVLPLISLAVMISIIGLIFTALLVGGEPNVAGNSVLTLKGSGDLQELEPGGVIGQFLEPPPTVCSIVDALRKAKVDSRVRGVIARPRRDRRVAGQCSEGTGRNRPFPHVRRADRRVRRDGLDVPTASQVRR